MQREFCAALSILVVIVGGVGIAQAAAPVIPSWSYSVIDDNVPLGNPIVLSVLGPPNGTFTVEVTTEPFNESLPVFAQTYQEPKVPSMANGSSQMEVNVNTTLLGVEAVQITLLDISGKDIGVPKIAFISSPQEPIQALEAQIDQLWFQQNVSTDRQMSLLYAEQQLTNEMLFMVGIAISLFVIEVFLIFATRTSAQERRLMAKATDTGHRILWQKRGVEHTGSWTRASPATPADPRAVFIAKNPQCEVCEMPQQYPAAAAHLRVDHHVPAEQIGGAIVASPEAGQRIRESMRAQRDIEGPTSRGKAKASKASGVHVDLSGIIAPKRES
jgi:hypothetical protein